MKKYVLTIKYNEDMEDIESIEEYVEKESREVALPEDTILLHKCITPHYDNNPKRYDELMSLGVDGGFIIGDA